MMTDQPIRVDDSGTRQLRGVITDEILEALRQRNAQRRLDCLAEMGSLWLLHPDNAVTRRT